MKTIAIGMLALALAHSGAAAQTAGEQAQILRGFQQSVADYTQRHQCLDLFPEALNAAAPAPRIFTLPVAMVFRQLIAQALAEHDGPAIQGTGPGEAEHVAVLAPLPAGLLYEFPKVLKDALPALPAPLEYRMVGNDLVVRDQEADLVVGVLREAVSSAVTVKR